MNDSGLTTEEQDAQPWGIPRQLLKPWKVITDPVHGDIYLNWLEVAIADSPPFQRLRRVRQLGTTHLVYPGATHSRLSHSLGAVRVVQELLDQILDQREGLHAIPDLFGQWQRDGVDKKNVARAKSLARLGGLLHDLCHVPVGHSIEDDLRLLDSHDENMDRFEFFWSRVASSVDAAIKGHWPGTEGRKYAKSVEAALFSDEGELRRQLEPLIISKRRKNDELVDALEPHEMEYPFVADLVGNTICADLLDYLERDHLFTGLPAKLGHRFISAFYVVPAGKGPLSERMALNIQRQEHERPDVVSEVLKAMRYRYEVSERALYHHAKLSADAMLGEALERWEGALWLQEAEANGYLDELPGHEKAIAARQVYRLKGLLEDRDAEKASKHAETVAQAVQSNLEAQFRVHGDDGLLEHMTALGSSPLVKGETEQPARELLGHSAGLATALLDRDLFRIAGRVGYKDTAAKALYAKFGSASARDELERSAESFAELGGKGDEPRVVIWLPKPGMRLKPAKVLVRHNAGITPFVEYEESRSGRGSDIYAAHQRLWSCLVFVRRDVSEPEQAVITTYLARQLGVRWERHQSYGDNPADWLLRLAAKRANKVKQLQSESMDAFLKKVELVEARTSPTFTALKQVMRDVADADG